MVFVSITDETFFVYKIGMTLAGNWPPDRNKYESVIIFSVTLFIEIALIVTRLINPFGKCSALDLRSWEFRQTSAFIAAAVQQLNIRAYGGRMIPLIESAIEDWSSIVDPEDRRIMKQHDKSMSFLCILHIIFLNSLPVIFGIVPMFFSNGIKLPNDRPICAFNDDFQWISVVRVLTVIVDVITHINIFYDVTLVWSLAEHISGQNKILAKQFRKFLLTKTKGVRRREFRRLVGRHNRLLDLTGTLDDSFHLIMGFEIAISQYFVCLGAFRFIEATKAVNFVEASISFVYTILLASVPFLYCYAGDCLIDSFEEIGEVFVQCNWHDLSKDSIINYSIVIARCQRPKILTAAKLYQLNLSNYKYMLKALYSVISLVVAMEKNTN